MNKPTRFKQTEIGMIPEDWEEVVFSEAIEVNPKRELKKGTKTKFVSMIDLEPFKRKISNFSIKEFNSGTKFKNKDILFARITPCLENGKIAFVDFLEDDEVGFGSTEFIVLSAKEGKTDSDFVFYVSRTPEVRQLAIKSMSGTSGRQRVENEVFDKIIIKLPRVPEQHAIAKILSDLDSKIELNQQMNKNLEAIGQALFKHWFIDFEFPNEEGKPYKSSGGEMVDSKLGKIPKGWKVVNIQEILKFEKGVEPGSECYIQELSEGYITFIRVGDISTHGREQTFIPIELSENKICNEEDILLSLDATIGIVKIGMRGAFSSGIRKVYSKETGVIPKGYIYSLLKSKYIQDIIYTYANGTTILHAGQALNHMSLAIPDKEIFVKFSQFSEPIFKKMVNNLIEINNLSQIRDILLPKLMSGKIRVPLEGKE